MSETRGGGGKAEGLAADVFDKEGDDDDDGLRWRRCSCFCRRFSSSFRFSTKSHFSIANDRKDRVVVPQAPPLLLLLPPLLCLRLNSLRRGILRFLVSSDVLRGFFVCACV